MTYGGASRVVGWASVWFLAALVSDTWAGSHLWRFNELFSNADGTIQFIEMKECCGGTTEHALENKWVQVVSADNQYVFPIDLTGNTANRHLLLATQGFADFPGAPTPDFIIPDNFLPAGGDTLEYWTYAPAVWTYGAIPVDGIHSLSRDGTTDLNSPTNYAGDTGSIVAECIDNDNDGYGSPGSPECPNGAEEDCNDGDFDVNPGAMEVCDDDVDNDCDTLTDCDDPDCQVGPPCIPTVFGWGLTVLSLLLLSAGTVQLKRLQTQRT